MVSILLAAGADCAAADKDGVQAMHHAAGGGRGGVIKLLKDAGAPLDVCSGSGTPLHWAAGEGHAITVTQVPFFLLSISIYRSLSCLKIFHRNYYLFFLACGVGGIRRQAQQPGLDSCDHGGRSGQRRLCCRSCTGRGGCRFCAVRRPHCSFPPPHASFSTLTF